MDKVVYQIIKDYRKALEGIGIKVERIVLYGSYASHSFREFSDIDLVVISDDFREMDLWERLVLLGQAAAIVRKPIEALGYTQEEFIAETEGGFIADEVKAKGVEIKGNRLAIGK